MTADLADRLELCAHNCEEYSPHEVGTLVNGIGYLAMCALLHEAASALRSRGEAVAWLHTVVQGDGPEDQALSFAPDNFPFKDVGGFRSLRAAPLYLHPATPASAPVEYEFEVWQDDSMQAGGSTTDLETAKDEAAHYALMYGQDGPVTVKFYERREIDTPEAQGHE